MEAPLALYRRYRPDTYAEVIGQSHVTEPLQQALRGNRVHHAYLFSGPRGCGKTTSARILARCLNCEKGPTPEPCGTCRSCEDLARGGPGSIDVIEIDAASHGGVDDARDLRERAFFAPVAARYKIYIVDEAHMVTTQGFNALLKLVEEPPDHLKFIFATTEPDKVIGTIRSRTHHYPFRLVPPKVLQDYLADLCVREGVSVDQGALPLIVRAGGGSVRDTLSVLDQLMGGAGEEGVTYAGAVALLGYTHDALLDEVVDAFAAGDGAGVFGVVDKVIESGQDPRRFGEDLLRRLRDLVIISAIPDAGARGLLEGPPDQADRLAGQAARFGAAALSRAGDVLNAGLTEMRGATAPRLHLELICARILLPASDDSEQGVHARLDRVERRLSIVGDVEPGSTAPAAARPSDDLPAGDAPADDAPVEVGARREGGATGRSGRTTSSRAPRRQSRSTQETAESSAPAPTVASPSADETRSAPSTVDTSAGSRASTSGGAGSPASWDTAPAEPTRTPDPVSGSSGSGGAGSSESGRSGSSAGSSAGGPGSGGSSPGSLGLTDIRRLWPDVLEAVKNARRFTWVMLSQNAQVTDLHNGTLTIGLTNAGARDSFGRSGSEDVLRQALRDVVGVDWRIEAVVDPQTGGSGHGGGHSGGSGGGPGGGGPGGGGPGGGGPGGGGPGGGRSGGRGSGMGDQGPAARGSTVGSGSRAAATTAWNTTTARVDDRVDSTAGGAVGQAGSGDVESPAGADGPGGGAGRGRTEQAPRASRSGPSRAAARRLEGRAGRAGGGDPSGWGDAPTHDPDGDVDPDTDSVVVDTPASQAELLAREFGAEIIEERTTD